MKKLFMLLAFIITPLIISAQDFPGEKVELLQGKQLKVKPVKESLKEYGYRDFYTDQDLKTIYKKNGSSSDYNALENKVFTFVAAVPYVSSIGQKYYKLEINNPQTGTLYFNYDTKYSFKFPFEVIGGLTYPDGFFCERLTEENVSGNVFYSFPFEGGVQVVSTKRKSDLIAVNINIPVSENIAADANLKGVLITFDNGKTFAQPTEKIKHKPKSATGAGGVVVSVNLFIDGADIQTFRSNKIVAIKLDRFEKKYEDGAVIQEYVKCLTN